MRSRVVIGNGSMISFILSNHLQVVYSSCSMYIRVETDHLSDISVDCVNLSAGSML